ncbi:MAG: universal stress protein [Dehalococcoidia bacterium]|nr:MAG: universal stress protein [Dehalococcoidia bacterium]
MFEKILVPMDGSRLSSSALPYAIEVARRFDAEIVLFRAVGKTPIIYPVAPTPGTFTTSPITTQMIMESAEKQDKRNLARANRYLSRILNKAKAQGVRGSYHSLLGQPAKSIIDFYRQEAIDLVIMTTRGKSGLKRALLGSIADEVIREPGIPVLVIRPGRRTKK